MTTTSSTVLFTDKDTQKILLEECKRVAEIGGTYCVKQYYSGNWFVDIVINWPDTKEE